MGGTKDGEEELDSGENRQRQEERGVDEKKDRGRESEEASESERKRRGRKGVNGDRGRSISKEKQRIWKARGVQISARENKEGI